MIRNLSSEFHIEIVCRIAANPGQPQCPVPLFWFLLNRNGVGHLGLVCIAAIDESLDLANRGVVNVVNALFVIKSQLSVIDLQACHASVHHEVAVPLDLQ